MIRFWKNTVDCDALFPPTKGGAARYALVIGDEDRVINESTRSSVSLLKREGYEVTLVSPYPNPKADHYAPAEADAIRPLLECLKGRVTDKDDLVIHVSSHGFPNGHIAGLEAVCPPKKETCDREDLSALIDFPNYRRRTVIMETCYGGVWSERFLERPRTLFISPGQPGEVITRLFGIRFWSGEEASGVKSIDWHRRFAQAVHEENLLPSHPLLLSSHGFHRSNPPFESRVFDAHDEPSLQAMLASLAPGQRAMVFFGPPVCKELDARFEKTALQTKGEFLFIRARFSEKIAFVIDHRGWGFPVDPSDDLVDQLGNHGLAPDVHAALLRGKFETSWGGRAAVESYLEMAPILSFQELIQGYEQLRDLALRTWDSDADNGTASVAEEAAEELRRLLEGMPK